MILSTGLSKTANHILQPCVLDLTGLTGPTRNFINRIAMIMIL